LIAKYKRVGTYEDLPADAQIGCIILDQPFFLPRDRWIPVPDDFSLNLVQGKRYDATVGTGRALRDEVSAALTSMPRALVHESQASTMWSEPVLARRRLGQGAFRVVVTDIYSRQCAVTGEKTLPVLQAAHIVPVSRGGQHRPDNGLLLRSDIHTLFDLGYVTIDDQRRFRVSPKLRQEWSNGRFYYDLDKGSVRVPEDVGLQPGRELLQWHSDTVFRT
jgi:putative restriction endonuclease